MTKEHNVGIIKKSHPEASHIFSPKPEILRYSINGTTKTIHDYSCLFCGCSQAVAACESLTEVGNHPGLRECYCQRCISRRFRKEWYSGEWRFFIDKPAWKDDADKERFKNLAEKETLKSSRTIEIVIFDKNISFQNVCQK